MNWIIENKEWFLSGLGILIITSIYGFIKLLLNKNKENNDQGINQRQKGGEGSTNIQIGKINKK